MKERKRIWHMTLILALLVARLALINSEKTDAEVYGGSNVQKEEEPGGEEGSERETGMGAADAFPELYAKATDGQTVNTEEKTVFLTFDDGPSRTTCKVLDILKERGIKATFFIIGENLTEDGIECLKRAVEEGHVIGLHTDSHDYKKLYGSVDGFLSDYDKLSRRLVEILGECPVLFRFPGGSYNRYAKATREDIKAEMERRGFIYYDWNVSAEDSVGTPTAASILKNIFPAAYEQEQPVILMHDSAKSGLTAELLPKIIAELEEAGYQFDTLDHREPCQFSW